MNRLWHIIFILLFACICAAAKGEDCPPIRPDHPRIFFNNDSWPEVQKKAHGTAGHYLNVLLKKADKAPDNPTVPVLKETASRTVKQSDGTTISLPASNDDLLYGYGTAAAECALAWRFTGERKYLDKTKKLLQASVELYTIATEARRSVDWYSYSRINALCAYDWIFEAMTQEERKAFIVPMLEHVRLIQPEAGLKIPKQHAGSKYTGFYGMTTLLWYSGLAASGDGFCDSLARDHLERGYKLSREVCEFRNETSGDDGALISATPSYSMVDYPFAHFNFFFTMRSAAGLDIAGNYPKMALFPQWIWWTWIRDAEYPEHYRFAGQGDISHATNKLKPVYLYEHCINYSSFFAESDPQAAAFASALRKYSPDTSIDTPFPIYPFILDEYDKVDPLPEEKLETCSLKCRHFETAGQFLMRSAWKPDATYCTFTAGGVFREHKHYDENNFIIYKYDHLALDTGDRGNSTDLNLRYYYAQSVAHNVVLIHKPGEPAPRHWGPITDDPVLKHNYGGMVKKTGAEILAYETGPDFTYIASDATDCYGEKCSEAVRQFVFVYPDCFIVYDRVCSTDPSYGKEWLLHTKNRPSIKKNMIRTDSGDGRLWCQVVLPENRDVKAVGGPGKEFLVNGKNCPIDAKVYESIQRQAAREGRGPYTGEWRIEVKPTDTDASTRFLHILTATKAGKGKAVKTRYLKEDARDGVVLYLDGGPITFWFNRKGLVGGEVKIGNETRRLTTEIQKQAGILL